MILKISLVICIFFYSFKTFSTNIRVLDLQFIIDNNQTIKNLITDIENDQKKYLKKFKNTEIELQTQFKKIEELELILEPNELDKEIIKYNEELKKFNIKIENFNKHYDDQVSFLKGKILESILEILKKYSLENEIDLILDANNYILSNNSIDITNILLDEINKTNYNISFEKYK